MIYPILPLQLNLYGILIAVGILVGTLLCIREEKLRQLPKDLGVDIILYAVPLAVIFSRIYYVIFAWDQFRDNPVSALYIWEGGLAIYGGIIGGVLGLWLLSKRRRQPMPLLTDIAVPSLLLGQAIGRWGNYFNGEAHGNLVQNAAYQFFPAAVQINQQWFYATFFYESVWNFVGFMFLYLNRKRFVKQGGNGDLTLWYLLWYGLGRMVIEMLRTDSLMLGSMRVSQGLSILLVLAAAALLGKRRQMKAFHYAFLAVGIILSIFAATQENFLLLVGGALLIAVYSVILYGTYGKIDAPSRI